MLLALALLLAVGLENCNASPPQGQSTAAAPRTAAAAVRLKVVTTTLPLTDFTKAVAGDRAEVVYLLPTGVGPHDFQARPNDVQKLAEANLLVQNGLGLEAYLTDLIRNAGNPRLQVVDTSQGIQPISNQAFEGQSAAAGADHAHEGEFNPHVWLDPTRAIRQVENIRDGLIAADPEGKSTYMANAAACIDRLKALDAEFAVALKPYAGKAFVTYHDFAPYFAQRYRLKAEFLVGVPEENPSPQDVQRVMTAAKSSELKTLLTEPQAAGNPFEALSQDLKVQVSDFDPMETSPPDGVQPDYYFAVMRQNLKNIQTAFGAPQSVLPFGQKPIRFVSIASAALPPLTR